MVLQDKGGQDYLANPKLAGMDLDGPHAVRFTLHDRGQTDGLGVEISARLDPSTGILHLAQKLTLPAGMSCSWLSAPAVPAPAGMSRIIDSFRPLVRRIPAGQETGFFAPARMSAKAARGAPGTPISRV